MTHENKIYKQKQKSMNIHKLKEYMEEQFVEDYSEIKKFMDNVNETLGNIGIEKKYEEYNDFCIDIEKNVFEMIEKMKEPHISPKIMVDALNKMVKYKILQDEQYENKIKTYFNTPETVLDDINRLKLSGITS